MLGWNSDTDEELMAWAGMTGRRTTATVAVVTKVVDTSRSWSKNVDKRLIGLLDPSILSLPQPQASTSPLDVEASRDHAGANANRALNIAPIVTAVKPDGAVT